MQFDFVQFVSQRSIAKRITEFIIFGTAKINISFQLSRNLFEKRKKITLATKSIIFYLKIDKKRAKKETIGEYLVANLPFWLLFCVEKSDKNTIMQDNRKPKSTSAFKTKQNMNSTNEKGKNDKK